ncbi:MAG: hypothetical protein DCC55_32340 [Chloroflexi bacterium]|nr:MAG: hypothetical protein DCC55_32340 [Chloroflexota bacterium]
MHSTGRDFFVQHARRTHWRFPLETTLQLIHQRWSTDGLLFLRRNRLTGDAGKEQKENDYPVPHQRFQAKASLFHATRPLSYGPTTNAVLIPAAWVCRSDQYTIVLSNFFEYVK